MVLYLTESLSREGVSRGFAAENVTKDSEVDFTTGAQRRRGKPMRYLMRCRTNRKAGSFIVETKSLFSLVPLCPCGEPVLACTRCAPIPPHPQIRSDKRLQIAINHAVHITYFSLRAVIFNQAVRLQNV